MDSISRKLTTFDTYISTYNQPRREDRGRNHNVAGSRKYCSKKSDWEVLIATCSELNTLSIELKSARSGRCVSYIWPQKMQPKIQRTLESHYNAAKADKYELVAAEVNVTVSLLMTSQRPLTVDSPFYEVNNLTLDNVLHEDPNATKNCGKDSAILRKQTDTR
jgi:hypothetical protein